MNYINSRILIVLAFVSSMHLLSMEREEQPGKGKEEEIEEQKVPKSLITFIFDNIAKLREGSSDDKLVTTIVGWINNNEVNVREQFLLKYLPADIDIRIAYALLRSPYVILPPDTLNFYLHKVPGMELPDKAEATMREYLTMHLLVTPFSVQHVLERWAFSNNLQLVLNLQDELKALRASKNTTRYLSQTKNLDLVRALLFLARYSQKFTGNDLNEFKKQTEHLTGNETAPDGTTALMFAVGGGYLELVRELLKLGANPFLTNRYGDDAFSLVEIQRHRAAVDQDFEQQAIYEQIQRLLEPSAKERAKVIEDRIAFFMVPREVVKRDGSLITVPGLPEEIARLIVMNSIDERERNIVARYIGRITPEMAELRAAHPRTEQRPVATPALFERLKNYLSAAGAAAWWYYLTRSSNP